MREISIRNNKILSLYNSILVISTLLSKRDKLQIFISAILILISSILEVITIATVYPFLVFAFGGESDITPVRIINFEAILDLCNGSIFAISMVYILFAIFALVFKVFIIRKTGLYIAHSSSNLATQVFERTVFGNKELPSSQEVVSSILLRCNYAMGVFINVTSIFTAVVLIVGIIYTLLSVSAIVTITGSVSVAVCYLLTTTITSKKSMINGAVIDQKSVHQLKHSIQCLGNLKNIVIEGRIKNELRNFKELDISIRLSRLSNHLINSIPRSAIETLVICTIIASTVYASRHDINVNNLLPMIGLYAIAFQKILPSINSLFINYSNILQSSESIEQLATQIAELEIKEDFEDRYFKINKIEIINVSNKHKQNKENLYQPVNYFINKGDKIIIKGRSGVGKSTFIESFVGLNKNYSGEIRVNDEIITSDNIRLWWNSLTYIPQVPYIFDHSLYYNITLSEDRKSFNANRYDLACRIANLPFGNDFNKHQNIYIHENGSNLSGGEKQRLLIARAIYRGKEVIVADESLSALDSRSRQLILSELIDKFPETTILYISHNAEDSKLFKKQITLVN